MKSELIKEIIKAIDDELIDKKKPYLLSAQANKLLVSKNVITISEKINGTLKELLEENKVPHAFKSTNKPRRWVIPLSDEGEKRKNGLPKQETKQPSDRGKQKNQNFVICPYCNVNSPVPNQVINETYLECNNCKEIINNPFSNDQKLKTTKEFPKNAIQEKEHLKDQFLKYVILTSIGLGIFFPPIWIGTAILFIYRVMRK